MTYAQLLLAFVAAPTVALGAAVLVNRLRKRGQTGYDALWPKFVCVLALMGIATLYTIPWDDHLIALGVWRYNPTLLCGLFIGHIPLEETLFFPLQTLLVGVWWIGLSDWIFPPGSSASEQPDSDGRRGLAGRVMVCAAGSVLWIGALSLLGVGWPPGIYLAWEAVWALPPLLLQVVVGGDILWDLRRLVGWVVVPAALYLSAVDALALQLGIWTINPRHSLSLLIGGRLPVEELLFYVVTSALVGLGVVLGNSAGMRRRIEALFKGLRSHEADWTPRWPWRNATNASTPLSSRARREGSYDGVTAGLAREYDQRGRGREHGIN